MGPLGRGWPQRSLAQAIAAGIAVMVVMAAGPAFAQSDADRIAELERKLEQSLKLIQQLSEEVRALKGEMATQKEAPARASPGGSPGPAPGQPPAAAAASEPPSSTPSALEQLVDTLGLHAFADVGATLSKNTDQTGFNVGSLDLYFVPNLGNRVKALFELLFELDSTGDLAVDLERAQIGYTFSDALTLWGGRFHSPYGYWNTAFHHGAQVQTSIRRPRFIDFEDKGGVLPSHSVGVLTTGAIPAWSGKLSYDLYFANSSRIEDGTLKVNTIGLKPFEPTGGINVAFSPTTLVDGLKVGLHGMTAGIRDDATPQNKTRMNTVGAYAVYDADNWELIAEYYRFFDEDVSGGTGYHGSWAAYVQLARAFGRWIPFVRWEKGDFSQDDLYFLAQDSGRPYERWAGGLRFDVTPSAALKLEFDYTTYSLDGSPDTYELLVQYAIRF
jgi:hypothetical protein